MLLFFSFQNQYTKLINDKSEFGQQFLKSLILSEAAKKYSIARELMLTDSYRIFIKSVLSSVVLMPMYALGSYVHITDCLLIQLELGC